jgi:glycosyltransferase involved in cell wall biosynthesis
MNTTVAIFLPSLGGGGAERSMLSLARGLAAQNFEVNLVVSQAGGPYMDEAADSLSLVNLNSRSVMKSIPGLVRYLRAERPKALISALDHANLAAIVASQLSLTDTRLVVTTHTIVSLMMSLNKTQVSRAMMRLMRILYPRADHVVAVSRAVALDLSNITGLPRESIRVVYNPVETHRILSRSVLSVDTTWFGPNEPRVVLSAGSLWAHKDHKTLIEAFGIVKRNRKVRLVILGEGPERISLMKFVRQHGLEREVLMPGFVENPYSWMARSAVFALPSRWEGLPTVLVEAMACGLSATATDSPGGTAEILDCGRYGHLTPIGDAPAMADAITDLLDRPIDPGILRHRAEDFSQEKAVSRYKELILESKF